MSEGIQINLPPSALAEIVQLVGERVRSELADSSPWLTRQQAADYLQLPLSRLEKDKTVPSHRWEGRVLYDRRELDEWISTL